MFTFACLSKYLLLGHLQQGSQQKNRRCSDFKSVVLELSIYLRYIKTQLYKLVLQSSFQSVPLELERVKVKWGELTKKALHLQTLFADTKPFFCTGMFFSLQTLSSIILIALCSQTCPQKNFYHLMRKLRDVGNCEQYTADRSRQLSFAKVLLQVHCSMVNIAKLLPTCVCNTGVKLFIMLKQR